MAHDDNDPGLRARVEQLEREVDELKRQLRSTRREKDWRRTYGMSANDPIFDEIIELGKEYRQSQPLAGDDDAGP